MAQVTCYGWLAQFGGHHRLEDYARRGAEPKDEVQVYTWPDASLRELTDLVKEVQPAARRSTARLDFALVYPDKRGRNVMRVVRGLPSPLGTPGATCCCSCADGSEGYGLLHGPPPGPPPALATSQYQLHELCLMR